MDRLCFWLLASTLTFGQPLLHIKNLPKVPSGEPVIEIASPAPSGAGHLLIQFAKAPSPAVLDELSNRGVMIVGVVPENGFVVTIDHTVPVRGLGIRYAARFTPESKVSPLIISNSPAAANGYSLVEFQPDIDLNFGGRLLTALGVEIIENPNLAPHELLVHASADQLAAIASLDAVDYIFPASDNLVNGLTATPCAGAETSSGDSTQQYIPTYGPGWAGPSGSATVYYFYSNFTEQLPTEQVQQAIENAMAQWSHAVQVTWAPGASATANQTVNILWATYAHGDGYPFTGPGGVLAHTFYPAPPNPEPIAGDMHFNDSETWGIGVNTDVFSVALHELGHSLGLGHADDPSAVMYPYYQLRTGLSNEDIAAVETLYAARVSTPPPAPTSPAPTPPPSQPAPSPTPAPSPAPTPVDAIAITSPTSSASYTSSSSTITLSGTASATSGVDHVSWSSSQGSSGTASGTTSWTAGPIQLSTGVAMITITLAARDGTSATATSSVTYSPSTTDTTPPTLNILSPSGATVDTSASTIVFSGTASDNDGVTSVTWSTNTNQSGTAVGTTSWKTQPITLYTGTTVVTIKAFDAAGNFSWRTVDVVVP